MEEMLVRLNATWLGGVEGVRLESDGRVWSCGFWEDDYDRGPSWSDWGRYIVTEGDTPEKAVAALYAHMFPLPTEEGRRRLPPDGYYRDDDDEWPCTCTEKCPDPCRGHCDCPAHRTLY